MDNIATLCNALDCLEVTVLCKGSGRANAQAMIISITE